MALSRRIGGRPRADVLGSSSIRERGHRSRIPRPDPHLRGPKKKVHGKHSTRSSRKLTEGEALIRSAATVPERKKNPERKKMKKKATTAQLQLLGTTVVSSSGPHHFQVVILSLASSLLPLFASNKKHIQTAVVIIFAGKQKKTR